MSDKKKQLGKILLKRQVVSQADLDRTLADPTSGVASPGVPLASRLLASGLVTEADALRGLSEQLGVPAVDVQRIGLSTAHLLLSEALANKHMALVLFADEARALVAFANPDDGTALDEVTHATSRAISPYVALTLPLRRAIDEAYAAARAGRDTYYGRHARTAEDRETLLNLATFLPKEKRSDDATVFTDDSLRNAIHADTLSMREVGQPTPARQASQPDGAADLEELLAEGARAFHEDRHDDGIEVLRRAVGSWPKSFRARYQLGLMLGRAGRVHEAITEIDVASTLDPLSFSAAKNLALLHEKAGFRGRAVTAWERALSLAPDENSRARVATHIANLSS